jgi:hypothetical protein
MKILLTLDLNQPHSEERVLAESLIRWVGDQLQATQSYVEILKAPAKNLSLLEWASQPSSLKKYKTLAPSPLKSYDLIIGIDLPPVAEALFTSLGIRTLILRGVPCPGFSRFVLARANFQLSEEERPVLPFLKNFFFKHFPPIDDASPPQRNWWLGNQYLLKQKASDPLILCIGNTLFQPERIRNGSLVNLSTYADTLLPLLHSSPSLHYVPRFPADTSEIRFIKSLGGGIVSLSLPELLARDEFDYLISTDSGIVPVAEAFHKKVTLLGTHPTWTVRKLHQFCNRHFIEQLVASPLIF